MWKNAQEKAAGEAQAALLSAKKNLDDLIFFNYLNVAKKTELETLQRKIDRIFDQLNKFYK